MRLRLLLPTLEFLLSIPFVFIPLWTYLPSYRLKGPDGKELVCHDNCPHPNLYGIDSVMYAKGSSLPAAIIVVPILSAIWDYSRDDHDYFHDPVWQAVGYVLVGILVWFFVGRFLDDALAWRQTGIRPAIWISDFVFSLTAAGVATLAAASVRLLDRLSIGYIFWSAIWILLAYSSLAMRVTQFVRARTERALPANRVS